MRAGRATERRETASTAYAETPGREGDDVGEPNAGVLDHGSGDLAGPRRGPVDGRVVPEQGDYLPGRERVSPTRGRHRGRGHPRCGQPLIASDVRPPLDRSHNRTRDAQLERRRRATVVVVPDIPTRGALTGNPAGPSGRVSPIAWAVPRAPSAVACGLGRRRKSRWDRHSRGPYGRDHLPDRLPARRGRPGYRRGGRACPRSDPRGRNGR